MPWPVDPKWEAAFGIAGTVGSVFLFMAPLDTFRRIVSRRDTEEFRSFPYVASLLNCLVWGIYCLPWVTPNRISPLVTNAIGISFQGTYVTLFSFYAHGKAKRRVCGELTIVAGFMLLLIGGVIFMIRSDLWSPIIGGIASLLSIVMFGSPLSALAVVLRTQSVEFMPLPLSLMGFISSGIWTGYGIYVQDILIIVTYALAALLGLAQLIIYCVISAKSKQREPSAAEGPKNEPGEETQLVTMKTRWADED